MSSSHWQTITPVSSDLLTVTQLARLFLKNCISYGQSNLVSRPNALPSLEHYIDSIAVNERKHMDNIKQEKTGTYQTVNMFVLTPSIKFSCARVRIVDERLIFPKVNDEQEKFSSIVVHRNAYLQSKW